MIIYYRWYIETGELDFYNHSELCTGRCKGRIPNKTAAEMVTMKRDPSPMVSGVSNINEQTYTSLPDHSEEKWKRVITLVMQNF